MKVRRSLTFGMLLSYFLTFHLYYELAFDSFSKSLQRFHLNVKLPAAGKVFLSINTLKRELRFTLRTLNKNFKNKISLH